MKTVPGIVGLLSRYTLFALILSSLLLPETIRVTALQSTPVQESQGNPSYRPPDDIRSYAGEFDIGGSSTVWPLTDEIALRFDELAPDVDITVSVAGTTSGFQRFCAAETEIINASREISATEIEQCEREGTRYQPFIVAKDGITVVANHESTFVSCLTTDQLRRLWEPGSEIDQWSDLDPAWPESEIELVGPGPVSGTFDYFTEAIVGVEGFSRTDYNYSEIDLDLVEEVKRSEHGLGYFGYSYYQQNMEELRAIAVDSGQGCVLPSPESIGDGSYEPLSRPLMLYVNLDELDRPEVQEFLRFYLANVRLVAAEIGFVAISAEAQVAELELLEALIALS